VCPNWRNEFERWLPECEIILYDGNGWERRALRDQVLRGKFQVIITHYDLVMRDKATLTKPNWHYLIIDEGHRLKNHESVLARCLGQHYRSRQRLLLTGTPIQNNLNELWSLLNFILPHVFKSSASFDEWFGTIGGTANATDGDLMVQEEEELLIIQRLHQVIRPFILRRKKSEVAKELPAKEQKVLHCDMSAWQKHYYKQIVESASIGGETGRSRALANSAMQLRKCCNHPYLFLDAYMPLDARERVRAAGKFDLLDHLLPKLKASGHRILLFSQMTKMLDMLEDWLTQLGFVFMRLDGTTKTEDRDVLLRDFNAPDSPYFIFLLSTRAGGLGLNLQTADTVIMFDSDWNPQADSQAEDRAHRIGQKSQVRVFVLVTMGTIEEEIQKRAQSKRGLDGKVIQAGMFNNQSTVNERREMLSEVMTRGYNEVGRNIPTLPEINQLAARSEEELELFERMDAERLAKEGEGVSRLMEDHELPEWVTAVEEPKEDEPEELTINAAGKSVRKRKEVVYKDVLTDRQFDMLVDHDDGATRLENFTAKKVAMHLGQRPDGDSDADVANGEEAGGGGGGDVKRQRT
jgi:SWI/SNF-related matrix-associated actin-dependent regulator of chromatin subfamily A protein 2/4